MFEKIRYVDVFQFKDKIEKILELNDDNPCPVNQIRYGDRWCTGELNTKENCFDGGDCCVGIMSHYCKLGCKTEDDCKCYCI